MQFIANIIFCTLKCLLLCFCPFGRAGRKEYTYYNHTTLVLAVLVVGAFKYLPARNPALWDTLSNNYTWVLVGGCVWVVVASYSVLVRRGHDLGYGWFATLWHSSECMMFKGWQFNRRLFKEEGSPLPNKYGPAPKENQL